jgi:hypothetical protein
MKFNFTNAILLVSVMCFTSCTSLRSSQDRELKTWQAKNLEVQDKKPAIATALNVLPGIGDFYNGNIGLGVVNLLAWPFSVLWAPIGGASGADEVNYYATKSFVDELESNKKKVKNEAESALVTGQMTKDQYFVVNQKIEAMELIEFQKKPVLGDIMPNPLLIQERIPSSAK